MTALPPPSITTLTVRGGLVCIAAVVWSLPTWGQALQKDSRAGIGVDFLGNLAVDPTKNVEALVKALEEKTRELREADIKINQSKLDAIERIADLREKHEKIMREAAAGHNKMSIDAAVAERNSELKRIDEVAKLRSDLNDKLVTAERDRINAIRLVDVSAAADLQRRTSESSTTLQTQTAQLANDLRTQTALLADNLRTLVASTAATQLAAQKQTADETSKRLTTIEQAQSEGRGKQQYQDPSIAALVLAVEKLQQQRSTTSGGSDMLIYLLGFILALAMAGIAIVGLFLSLRHKPA